MSDFEKNLKKSIGKLPATGMKKDGPDLSTPSEFFKRRMEIAGGETFVKRNLAGKIVDKLPGTIGKAVGAGALAGVALEKGINKLKSKKGEDAKPEIPSGEEVQGKSKGGYVKKPYRMHNGKF